MKTHLISYDLKVPGKDYSHLHSFLKSGGSWAKPLESVWLVKSSLSAEEYRNAVNLHVDKNDKILVIDVTSDASAWFNLETAVSDWIQTNL